MNGAFARRMHEGTTMPVTVVLGGQWGDEGKGQVTDTLARDVDIVARATGGSNAGHTVINEQGRFAVHLIPSGIFTPGTTCVLGNGMVIGPQTLINEMDTLAAHGIDLSRRTSPTRRTSSCRITRRSMRWRRSGAA